MALIPTLRSIANHPLNRSRKTWAMLNFLKWQIGTRLVPGSVVVEWVCGTRFIARRGDVGITQNVYCGLHDFSEMAYVLHVLRSSDLFVDIGANLGSYTILACAARGARGYCFEPVPETYQSLLDNVAINNISSHVVALNIGLADVNGELTFTADRKSGNHVIANNESSANSVRVPVRTLDSILANESPTLLKMDVEGFETPILDGAKATLGKSSLHSVIMELNGSGDRYGFDEDKILRLMREYGFSPYAYEPFSRDLRPIEGKSKSTPNTLFLRNESHIRERIEQAPRIKIGPNEF